MKNRKLAWVVTILLVVVAIAFGQFKAPVKQSSTFYLTDKADLFSSAEETSILTASKNLLQTGGARMVIVTVNHTGLRGMESYAETLWDNWKLSGMDLLLLMKDDDYYFLYGSELSYAMDSNYRTLLDRYLEPEFAVGNYNAAVLSFIGGCGSAISGGGSWGDDWDDAFYYESGFSLSGIVMGIILVVVIIAVCSAFSKARPASKRRYYGGYATPSAGTFMNTVGRAATRSAMNTMSSTIRRSSFGGSSRPAGRPTSRPSSFGGGGRRSGGSFGGGGGRGGGSRGGGGRR